MKRRELAKALAVAGGTLVASRAIAGPATSGLRSNFAFNPHFALLLSDTKKTKKVC